MVEISSSVSAVLRSCSQTVTVMLQIFPLCETSIGVLSSSNNKSGLADKHTGEGYSAAN